MEEIKKVGIQIDDGTVEVPITNNFGKQIGVFYFRPTDINILKRYKETIKKIGEISEPLIDANINTDGKGEDELSTEIIEKAESQIYDIINYLFDGDVASAFFGSMNPFSPTGGRFYCEVVVEAVGQFIASKFEVEMKGVSGRLEKHTHGYRTGKHAKGKQ